MQLSFARKRFVQRHRRESQPSPPSPSPRLTTPGLEPAVLTVKERGALGAGNALPQPSPPQPGPGSPRDTCPSRRKGCARQGAGCHQPELSCPRWVGGQGVGAAPSASDPRQCGAAQRRRPRPGPVRPCGRALPSERALPPRPSDARRWGDSQPEGAAGGWAATRRLSEPRQPRDLCEGLSISSRPADGAGRGVQPSSREAAGPL